MMRNCAFVLLCICVPACGDSGSSSSADMAVAHDMAAPLPPAAYVGTKMAAPDLSCLGTRMDPTAPDADQTVSGVIKDFQDSNPVQGAIVSVYFSSDDAVAGKAAAQSAPSDAMGNYTITIPAGHYRVIYGNAGGKAISSSGSMVDTIPAYEFGRAFDDKERAAVKVTTRDAIPSLVGLTPDPALGVFAGSARDCKNQLVGGAQAFVSGTSMPYDSSQYLFYFKTVAGAPLPLRAQKWTTDLGLWAALNVPPGTATMEAKIVPTAGATLVTLGSTTVPIIAGAITIADVLPAGPQ